MFAFIAYWTQETGAVSIGDLPGGFHEIADAPEYVLKGRKVSQPLHKGQARGLCMINDER